MRNLLLALISILFLASLSTAQEQPQHPIDKALDACIDKNGSTAGMVECTAKAYAAWDKELNKNYGELMRALNPKQKEALRLAQLEWIKYRDLEFKSIDCVYDTLEGTMYIPMRISAPRSDQEARLGTERPPRPHQGFLSVAASRSLRAVVLMEILAISKNMVRARVGG